MSAHTPRPWTSTRYTQLRYHQDAIVVIDASGRVLAQCQLTLTLSDAEVGANAALMASAPDLLVQRDALVEALRALWEWQCGVQELPSDELTAQVAAAMAGVKP